MARQSKAEATGRRICGRDGPRDGSRESQSSAAALGGRGAAAGAARRRPNGEEHHGVGRGAGLRSSAAAEAESLESRSQQDLRLGTNFGREQLLKTKARHFFAPRNNFCAQEQFSPLPLPTNY